MRFRALLEAPRALQLRALTLAPRARAALRWAEGRRGAGTTSLAVSVMVGNGLLGPLANTSET